MAKVQWLVYANVRGGEIFEYRRVVAERLRKRRQLYPVGRTGIAGRHAIIAADVAATTLVYHKVGLVNHREAEAKGVEAFLYAHPRRYVDTGVVVLGIEGIDKRIGGVEGLDGRELPFSVHRDEGGIIEGCPTTGTVAVNGKGKFLLTGRETLVSHLTTDDV